MAQPMTSGSLWGRPALMQRDYFRFVLGTAFGLIHIVDEVFRAREEIPGPIVPALALALLNLAALFAYRRLTRVWRAAASIFFGFAWAAGALGTHIIPWLLEGPSPGDYTGIPELLGGLLLLSLGVWLMPRRQEGNA